MQRRGNLKDKKFKFGFFLNLANFSPVGELHLAHILNLKKEVDSKQILGIICDGKFGGCSINPLGSPTYCHFCKKRAAKIVEIAKIESIFLSDYFCKKQRYIPSSLMLGAMSSVASHTRSESVNDLSFLWKFVLGRLHRASIKTYISISNILYKHNIEELYIFNGRFSCARSAKEAARRLGKTFLVYDVKGISGRKRPYIHKNIDLHNVDIAIDRALKLYKKNRKKAYHTAVKFFNDRRNQKDTLQESYTKLQEVGFSGITKKTKQLVVIFTQSDDEYRFLGADWGVKQRKVKCSYEILKISKLLPKEDFHIVIRIHPNQNNVRTQSLDLIRSLDKKENITVHEPNSRIDTYALMDEADVVITFASSISLEACYWKKLLIQIGPSMTSKLNIANRVNDGKECVDFLKLYNHRLNEAPKYESKNAIAYANYLMRYEDYLPGFKRIANGLYSVEGHILPITKIARILTLPERLILLIAKRDKIFSYKFIRKIYISIIDIINGTYQDQ